MNKRRQILFIHIYIYIYIYIHTIVIIILIITKSVRGRKGATALATRPSATFCALAAQPPQSAHRPTTTNNNNDNNNDDNNNNTARQAGPWKTGDAAGARAQTRPSTSDVER